MPPATPAFPFPDRPRLWGVAVSHYQVEGDDPCDWTRWEESGRAHGGACGRAVDSWRLYEHDLDLAAAAGANAFRFSVSWSRVEPRRNEFAEAALERYARLARAAVARGLEPVVTLLHYTHPLWFHDQTPWTSPASVKVFARFARRVGEALSPHVRLWTVLNEPVVLVLGGFLEGRIPPGVSDPKAAVRAFDHLLAAHAAAAAALREASPGAVVSVAHNMMGFAPDRPGHTLDELLARRAGAFYNEALLEAFATGRWLCWLPPATVLRGRRDDLPLSLDAVGVNYYSRLHLRARLPFGLGEGRNGTGKAAAEGLVGEVQGLAQVRYRDRSGRGLTDLGWEIAPELLHLVLHRASRLGKPVLVTENGLADGGDLNRSGFIVEHAEALEHVEGMGVPLAGYFHWSLLDNFEWLEGFGPKFGLYAVDRTTMARTPRPSVEVFRRLGREFLERNAPCYEEFSAP